MSENNNGNASAASTTIDLTKIGSHSLELFQLFKGLDLNQAIEKACINKLQPRIMAYDGTRFSLQKDIRYDRINFEFENGKVIDAYID